MIRSGKLAGENRWVGTSWRNRPDDASLFAGGLMGDDLQEGQVEQGGGVLLGGRLGLDFDHYWGVELRLAACDAQVNYPAAVGKNSNTYFDAGVLYYPLGDSRWRPYLTAGFGVAGYRFNDDSGSAIRTPAL